MTSTDHRMVDIAGLDRADVLAALYNASQSIGFSFLTPGSDRALTTEEAQQFVTHADTTDSYHDFVRGRVIKVDLPPGGVEFDPRWFDAKNGPHAARDAIARLRATRTPS